MDRIQFASGCVIIMVPLLSLSASVSPPGKWGTIKCLSHAWEHRSQASKVLRALT